MIRYSIWYLDLLNIEIYHKFETSHFNKKLFIIITTLLYTSCQNILQGLQPDHPASYMRAPPPPPLRVQTSTRLCRAYSTWTRCSWSPYVSSLLFPWLPGSAPGARRWAGSASPRGPSSEYRSGASITTPATGRSLRSSSLKGMSVVGGARGNIK